MADLTPITRQEKILAGENITPITRMEMFLKQLIDGGAGTLVAEDDSNGNVTLSIGGKTE